MAEEKAKICCMFSDPVPGHAVDNKSLERLVSDERTRREETVCRCKKCGAFVLYRYVETTFYSGWDKADIDEYYYPIEDPTADGTLDVFPEEICIVRGSKVLHCMYREEDWKKDRNWFFDET